MVDPIRVSRRRWIWAAVSLAVLGVVLVGVALVLASVRVVEPSIDGRWVVANLRKGSEIQLSPEAWRVGDVFTCEGVGLSVLLGVPKAGGIEIKGYEIEYGHDGSLHIVCGVNPGPIVHE